MIKIILLLAMLLLCFTHARSQNEILSTYLQGGMSALSEGQFAKAETLFRSAISEVQGSSLSPDKKVSAMIVALNGLSLALVNQQKFVDGESVIRKQIA